jgi:hypothetical protein
MFIYLIVNRVTGKYYVGQHKGNNLKKYLQTKLSDASHNRGGASRLFNSMRKHPKEVWSIHALLPDVQTRPELDAYERDFIAFLKSQDPEYGYNICRGGEGFSGPHTNEWKSKMREAWLRRKAQGYKYPPSTLAIDMTGKVINGIEVLSKVTASKSGGKKAHWLCRCHCGKIFTTLGASLCSGNTKSCGCVRRLELLQGKKFGRLTVLEFAGHYNPTRKNFAAVWTCQCDCGTVKNVTAAHLKSGNVKSCGCLLYEPRQFSEDHIRKLREVSKKPFSEERRRKIGDALRGRAGRRHSPKTRLKLSEAAKGRVSPMKGKRHSLETRLRMSDAAKKRYSLIAH